VGDTSNREWRILAIVLAGSFMAVLDTMIVNVTLPSIERGAHATSDVLEWVVSGYALTFGLALVPAGWRSDGRCGAGSGGAATRLRSAAPGWRLPSTSSARRPWCRARSGTTCVRAP